ncbi:hypothetical protein CAAN1_22S01970 [[Candida] anglica]|uniref:RRM domain-containing protein n=1 Tax=[Candida] anglica TaxID=148631 RepID=A0ABP0E9X5_9ASCO
MTEPTSKELRLHIGNISPKLAASAEMFEARLAKFGTITKKLEIKSKPLLDKYFGFVSMELTPQQYDKLKAAFHDILFMGMKLSVTEARSGYNWEKDHNRPDIKKQERINRELIAEARRKRIVEASTKYPTNSFTGELTNSSFLAANAGSLGYMKSSHTTNNKSANTKNKPPSSTLVGSKSYSIACIAKQPYRQQYSTTSGHGEVVQGRLRSTARPIRHMRESTLRILINGELKTYKNYKTKLWGMDTSKTARDLTWRYVEGSWKSGDDHIVERRRIVRAVPVDDYVLGGPEPVRCGANVEEYGKPALSKDSGEPPVILDEDLQQEIDKNNNVLASLFSTHDFDKPLEVEEDIEKPEVTFDSKGRRTVKTFDYEIEGADQNDDEDDDDENASDVSFDYEGARQAVAQYTKEHERPQEVYYDENDDGNNLDFDLDAQSTEALRKRYEDEHRDEEEEEKEVEQQHKEDVFTRGQSVGTDSVDETFITAQENQSEEEEPQSEEEFIPSFGQKTNNTETLRTLFNKEEDSTFKLNVEDDDDIDQEKEVVLDESQQRELLREIELKQQEELQKFQEKRRAQFGLFWTHSDSPFLATQSQLSKIGTADDLVNLPGEDDAGAGANTADAGEESVYEKWFWDHRGELSRECKRRKRDVVRAFKKKVNV